MLLGALAALAALTVGQASPYAANSVQAALTCHHHHTYVGK
jgi:hypothetical protein